jgi:hypothetical protein
MSATPLPITIQQRFVFFPGNDCPVLWSVILGSTWNTTDSPITDATGSLTITDANGGDVPGATALPFSPTATPGTYQAQIVGAGFNPTPGTRFLATIKLSSVSAQATGIWEIPTVIRPRNTPSVNRVFQSRIQVTYCGDGRDCGLDFAVASRYCLIASYFLISR